ncbi:hypothetical protein FB567DRAFT_588743 [Paraphoma chrysanthemicola]|uniref:DUF7580 domain-containing protein n=1 Tax=Paraphoma chrysanthemicola TaxID=798071 RepID=A0A8K0RGS1_9PLEO|nr:hypothetical protein FB567DRAFT_588743 [Paraphoma chrysanthemicola]
MSGIEIAGLALGAIPVILEAIQGYRNTYDRIQEFKQATKQLQILDAQFRVCRLNFLSECRLLLHLVLSDPQLSQEMITDTRHSLWQDVTVETQLSALLRGDLKACATIVADTTATIRSFDRRLTKLQISPNNLGGTLQRARISAAFVIEKSRFEKDIVTLRKRNADLNLLRIHFSSTDNPHPSSRAVTQNTREEIENFGTIRLASGLLHDTLKTAWSCSDATHMRHWVKLRVDSPKPRNKSVKLDLAVSSDMITPRRASTPTVWLYVQSESIHGQDQATHAAQQASVQSLVHNLQQSVESNLPSPLVSKMSSDLKTAQIECDLSNTVDLCKVNCVCSHLQCQSMAHVSQQTERCIGYLESMRNSRYLIYGPLPPGHAASSQGPLTTHDNITTLKDIIGQPSTSRLQLLHQYQLALRMARSVLQFHNTAWLPSVWKIEDLSVVGSNITDQSLSTLHLSTSFERATSTSAGGQALGGATKTATGATAATTPVDACCQRLSPAVYNESLFCLGIVLLEIAHCRTFEDMRQGDPDEFYAAHRIVRGPPPLGPKYRKIVERCLRCDFGAGSEDLEDAELQRAVWSKVVYPLEALVRDISA